MIHVFERFACRLLLSLPMCCDFTDDWKVCSRRQVADECETLKKDLGQANPIKSNTQQRCSNWVHAVEKFEATKSSECHRMWCFEQLLRAQNGFFRVLTSNVRLKIYRFISPVETVAGSDGRFAEDSGAEGFCGVDRSPQEGVWCEGEQQQVPAPCHG